MKKIIAIILCQLFLTYSASLAFAQNPININAIYPSSNPSSNPSSSPTTQPSPIASIIPTPNLSSSSSITDYCQQFTAAYPRVIQIIGATPGNTNINPAQTQEIIEKEYGLLFAKSPLITNNPEKVSEILKKDPNFANLSKQPLKDAVFNDLVKAGEQMLEKTKQYPRFVQSDYIKNWPKDKQQIQSYINQEMTPVQFYASLYSILNGESFKTMYVFTLAKSMIDALSLYKLPQLPYLIVNPTATIGDEPFFIKYASYPMMRSLELALNSITCSGQIIPRINSLSPIIYTYSPKPVNIKLPSAITYSNYLNYSFQNGISININNPLYYEVRNDLISRKILDSKNSQVVKGVDLSYFLYDILIPKLGLKPTELSDYLKLDVSPQLDQLNEQNLNQNYLVILLQNREVDPILPLEIKPYPKIFIRNLIVIKPITTPTTTTFNSINVISNNLIREENTIVENGFINLN